MLPSDAWWYSIIGSKKYTGSYEKSSFPTKNDTLVTYAISYVPDSHQEEESVLHLIY
jgi:hypothetical protein